MTLDQAIDTFSNYALQEKIDFLAHFAHTLTILARDTYEVGGEGLSKPSRLRRVNEVQHRLMGFLLALMKQEGKRYPDHVLVRFLLEHPDDLTLQHQLQEAFSRLTVQMASTT